MAKKKEKFDYKNAVVESTYIPEKTIKPFVTKTRAQAAYLHSIKENVVTFGIGPAGTGKSYVAISYAAELLESREIRKIVITKPVSEVGRDLGALPGELTEKYSPFVISAREILNQRLGKQKVSGYITAGHIEFRPLEYMRGSTFDESFLILDEAQNCTIEQMKMYLTRIGDNSKVVIDGDPNQKDIRGESGLTDAINRMRNVPRVGVAQFTVEDCVRSGICKDILKAYMV